MRKENQTEKMFKRRKNVFFPVWKQICIRPQINPDRVTPHFTALDKRKITERKLEVPILNSI